MHTKDFFVKSLSESYDLDEAIERTFDIKKEKDVWHSAHGPELITAMSTAHIENCIRLINRGEARKQAFILSSLEKELKKRKDVNYKERPSISFETYKKKIFTNKFIEENHEIIDWNLLVQHQEITSYIIEKYKEFIPWHLVYKFQIIPDEYIEKHYKEIKWEIIILDKKYDESFFEKWIEFINLKKLVKIRKLSFYFLETFYSFLNRTDLYRYQVLSEEFLEEHIKEINWNSLSYQIDKYSIYFIEKYSDKIQWKIASHCPDLPLNIIEKFRDKVNWDKICEHNKNITYEFIMENKDYLSLTGKVVYFLKKYFGSKIVKKQLSDYLEDN